MKHLLPVLALSSLAGASASAAGLSYNSVSASYAREQVSGAPAHSTSYAVSAQALIGASNFVVSASSTVGGKSDGPTHGEDAASLGYLFRNVGGVADATVYVASNDTVGVLVRKDVGSGFEVSAFYSRNNRYALDHYGIGAGYSFNQTYSLDLAYSHKSASSYDSNVLSAGLRYNF